VKISNALKMKIITSNNLKLEKSRINVDYRGHTTSIPTHVNVELSIDLSRDLKLLNECREWFNNIINHNLTEKIDIGYFIGLFPCQIDIDGIVTFTADNFNFNNQSWKDWFITEE